MTDLEKYRPAREVRNWVDAFERDPPLFTQFPVALNNGRAIPGLHVACSACRCRISGGRVHGRVSQFLPHVVSVTANAKCDVCDKITHIDCRFRTDHNITVIEWLGCNGRWQARLMQPESLGGRVVDKFRRLLVRVFVRSP